MHLPTGYFLLVLGLKTIKNFSRANATAIKKRKASNNPILSFLVHGCGLFKDCKVFSKNKNEMFITCPLINIVNKEFNIHVHCKRTEKPCPVW